MYNANIPNQQDLPSSASLMRSTFVAFVIACVVLVTIVLPSEYGIDPTRLGNMLGLTQMGEIKTQLANEAAADTEAPVNVEDQTTSTEVRLNAIDQRLDAIYALLEQQQALQLSLTNPPAQNLESLLDNVLPNEQVIPSTQTEPIANSWTDEISIVLAPGEGVEYKLVMREGAEAEFFWSANGSVLNYDTHGDGGGNSVSYEKGRSIPEDQAVLRAAFDGNHGWFFRNRTDAPVTLTLRVRGDYSELKRTV